MAIMASMFVDDLEREVKSWLDLREAEGLRPSTLESYGAHIHIFALWLRRQEEQELVPFAFAAFFRDYAKEHSPASCRSVYTSMRVFLRGIGRTDLMGRMKQPRGDTIPKTVYTPGQMKALFSVLRADHTPTGYRDHAIISLLRYCGVRASEACTLLLNDLLEYEDAIQVQGGKSRFARRKVPLITECPRVLALYLARGRPQLLRGYSDHLFLSVEGQPLTRDALRQLLRRRGEQVGFPLGAHRFRHTWTTAHVRARTSPPSIAAMAGWAPRTTVEMLQRYGHPDLDVLREAQAEAFGRG